jgi:hypothetical protein
MDCFAEVPNDILYIIICFVDNPRDYFYLFLVSKRFYNLAKSDNESQWKVLCLNFWKEHRGHYDPMLFPEVEFNLELAQKESGKSWSWFLQCFAKRIFFKPNATGTVIGLTPKDGGKWMGPLDITKVFIYWGFRSG